MRAEVAAERFGRLARATYDPVQPIPEALAFVRHTGAERHHVVSGAAEVELESVFAGKQITLLFASIQGSPEQSYFKAIRAGQGSVSLHISVSAQRSCRSKIGMSGLGQVEMSGSRYVTGHVGARPDHEQTRV